MPPGEGQHSSYGKDTVNLDSNSQLAIDRLMAQERQKKRQQQIVGLSVVILLTLFLTLVAVPWSFDFYCSDIIGTNCETLVIYNYPDFTEKMVRAAVIKDKWYLNIIGPVLGTIIDKEVIDYRRAVIELGLEITGNKERDPEKIRDLRAVVAASLNKYPGGVAFAVFNLSNKVASSE